MDRLFLIRHFWEGSRKVGDVYENFIMPPGFIQCEELKVRMEEYGVDPKTAVIVSSKQVFRSNESARMISQSTGIKHLPQEFDFYNSRDLKKAKALINGELAGFEDIIIVGHLDFLELFPKFILEIESVDVGFPNGGGCIIHLDKKTVKQIGR